MTHIVLEDDLSATEVACITRHLPANHYLLVSDANTWNAWGERLFRGIQNFPHPTVYHFQLPHAPRATLAMAEAICQKAETAEAVIAVGSGTINDLCKYASYLCKKPYMIAATAPSMNGYISATASLEVEDGKLSHQAHAPTLLLCDLKILTKAPKRLIQAGLGDTLCRSTVQADWLLSHLVLGTAYTSKPFDLLLPYEKKLLASANQLIKGDLESIKTLMQALLVAGEGMRLVGGSYSASQGEHMIAHLMDNKQKEAIYYHGEQIAVTTLTMARLQEKILLGDTIPQIKPHDPPEMYKDVYENKIPDITHIREMNERLCTEWPSIKAQIESVMLPSSLIENGLKKAGCPITPLEVGWEDAEYKQALAIAHFTRDRFTFLDFVNQ